MQAGDILSAYLDSISTDGRMSLATIRAVEGVDAQGNSVLLPGPKERKAIGPGDYRVDPQDPESDIDEAAYQAKVGEALERVIGKRDDLIEKIATKQAVIEALRQDKRDLRDRVQQLRARIKQLEGSA